MDAPIQLWVRNDKGQKFGPLNVSSIELLLDSGAISGRVQVSTDGEHYVFPGRLPGVRVVFPRALWGDTVVPGETIDAEFQRVLVPPPIAVTPVPSSSGSGLRPAQSGPSGLVAGPGATAAAQQRSAYAGSSRSSVGPSVPVIAPVVAAQEMPLLEAEPVLDAESVDAEPDVEVIELDDGPPSTLTPTPALVKESTLASSGSLAELSPMQLYASIAAASATGSLTIELSTKSFYVSFKKGVPDDVQSTDSMDSVASFLMQRKLIPAEQVKEAQKQQAQYGNDLTAALFGLRMLDPAKAFGQLVDRVKGLLFEALLGQQGAYSWKEGPSAIPLSLPLGDKWGLYLEFVRKTPIGEVRKRMQPFLQQPVLKSGGRIELSAIHLAPQELRAFGLLDGIRSVAALQQMHPQDGDVLVRLVWMLAPLALVSFDATRQSAPAAAPVSKTPAPQAQPPTIRPSTPPIAVSQPSQSRANVSSKSVATPSRGSAVTTPSGVTTRTLSSSQPSAVVRPPEDEKTLVALHKTLLGQNHFDALQIVRTADAALIRSAYLRFARLYHPDTNAPGTPEPIAALKASIFARINEANRVLSDAALRKEYEAELNVGGTGDKVDVSQIFEAEERFQKGMILVRARKFADAVTMLDAAIAQNGEEPEYFAWRGFAKLFATSDKKQAKVEALKDIEWCMKSNGRIAAAWYFKGFILKAAGDVAGAKSCFKTCIDLDSRHIDAARELRTLGVR
jgi:DnaJ domain